MRSKTTCNYHCFVCPQNNNLLSSTEDAKLYTSSACSRAISECAGELDGTNNFSNVTTIIFSGEIISAAAYLLAP